MARVYSKLPALPLFALSLRAHEGQELAPHDLFTQWVWDPLLVIPLLLSAILYWNGSRKAAGLAKWERRCFWTGWVVLAIALISPVHPLGERLFSMHMLQHELMMVAAAPLLILGRPLIAWLWALKPAARVAVGGAVKRAWIARPWAWITRPLTAFLIHLLALWLWHVPALYNASVEFAWVHALQHVSFLFSALLFWWTALRYTMSFGPGVFYIFATAVHTTILGALLTFSSDTWYKVYGEPPPFWRLTALEDQQLGGLIMWVPPGFVYLALLLVPFARLLRRGEGIQPVVGALLLATAGCGADPEKARAEALIVEHGCQTCHTIPGIRSATGTVGPPLTGIARRSYLAGRVENTPENMVRWLIHPQSIDEKTAMPPVGLTGEEADAIVRYLYRLR